MDWEDLVDTIFYGLGLGGAIALPVILLLSLFGVGGFMLLMAALFVVGAWAIGEGD